MAYLAGSLRLSRLRRVEVMRPCSGGSSSDRVAVAKVWLIEWIMIMMGVSSPANKVRDG